MIVELGSAHGCRPCHHTLLSASAFQFRIEIVELTARQERLPRGIQFAKLAGVEVATLAAETEDIKSPVDGLIGMMLVP